MSEGYVKYTADHIMAPPIEVPHWLELNGARTRLHGLGLVGVTSDGIGYGNLSIRVQVNSFPTDAFLITGTATGALPVLSPSDYCLVRTFDIAQNHVISTGPVQASSESMTHGAVYRSCPGANCVIHIHSRAIFDSMIRDGYPATPENALYGTPQIALAIGECVCELGNNEGQIVLAGHDEGVISYGPAVERAVALILELYTKYVI